MRRFLTIGYHMPIPIAPGVTLTFYDAGHILGAAQVVLDIDDEEDGQHKRLLFSGDVGRGDNELLRNPEAVPDVDIMLMEICLIIFMTLLNLTIKPNLNSLKIMNYQLQQSMI